MMRTSIEAELEDGRIPWPRRGRWLDVDVDEDTFIELLSGRRMHFPFDLGAINSLDVGDMVVFRFEAEQFPHRRPFVAIITHLWFHAGLAPDWAIASLRAVQLVPA